jgi:hypothetical protein
MKNICCVLMICISIISLNCQKEASFSRANFSHTPFGTVAVTVQGNIFDENGKPAIGVAVQAGIKSAVTNARGYFRIVNAVLDKNASLVTAEKKGYFKCYRTFIATSGVNQIMIKLVAKNLSGTVSSTSGGNITLSNGSKISLPANGIVRPSGGNYSGTVNVYASYIDPSAQDIAQRVPGSFTGENKNNKRVFLTSYGMLAVELESSSGEKLQIAPGSTATLTMPIPASIQANAPASISLWYIDEQTGVWKEEGTATKTGNSYVGQVKHFSFWNCDFGGPAVKLSMTLQNSDGLPLSYVNVSINSTTAGAAHGLTDSLGQVTGLVPANERLVLNVMDQCYNIVYSQNIGAFASSIDLGVIRLTSAAASVITIKGKLLSCNNTAVANGDVMIYWDNLLRYAKTDNNGDFSTSFVTCSAAPSTCQVLGVDNAAQQQSGVQNITVTAPITNVGDIAACGDNSLQYVNYILDGADFIISSVLNDFFSGQTGDSLSIDVTRIDAIHGPEWNPFHNASFSFNSHGSAGTFPLSAMYVNRIRAEFAQPLDVVITNFATKRGEFYEGSFNGSFNELYTGTTHTIACSFRVRR